MHTSAIMTIICTLSLKVFCRFIKYKRNALNDDISTLYYICSYLEKCISIQESPNIFIWMVKMHNSTFVTTICTISLKVFSRLIKYKRNALNDATSTLYYICSYLEKCISIQESPKIFIWMVKMHNSTFVTTICTISLKVFSRLIKYKRNALKDATSTLFKLLSYLEKCISIQKILNFCMHGRNVYLGSYDFNL